MIERASFHATGLARDAADLGSILGHYLCFAFPLPTALLTVSTPSSIIVFTAPLRAFFDFFVIVFLAVFFAAFFFAILWLP